MQYNTILQLLGALTNVVGTTYAVLSILKLKPNDLYQAITIDGMDKNDESLLTQKKQARIGISLVIYAWILQVIFSFCSISSGKMFMLSLLAYVVVTVFLCLCLFLLTNDSQKSILNLENRWTRRIKIDIAIIIR